MLLIKKIGYFLSKITKKHKEPRKKVINDFECSSTIVLNNDYLYSEHCSYIIGLSHSIVNAKQNLTLSEKRLFMLALTKIRELPNLELDPTALVHIRITANEFSEIYQLHRNIAYEQLEYASQGLIKKQLTVIQENGSPTLLNWTSSAQYIKGKAEIILGIPYYNLQKYINSNRIVKFSLEEAKNLKSIYSWRLLEILSQFSQSRTKAQKIEFELENLSEILGCDTPSKKKFSYIKKMVLERAIPELREKSKCSINWHPVKAGKKIIKICFTFKLPKLSKS